MKVLGNLSIMVVMGFIMITLFNLLVLAGGAVGLATRYALLWMLGVPEAF